MGVGFVLILATCRDGMEPQVHRAPIAVAPVLPSDAALASFGLAIDRVRFIVLRPAPATRDAPPDTLVDSTVALPPDSATLELDIRVPLIAAAETLQVSIVVLSGTIPLFEGTASVEVTSGAAPATPTEIPVQTYVGPGAGVDSIAILPALPLLFFNDSLRFQVEAFQAGVPVTQFYVSWSTSDTNVAKINGAGLLRAPASRTSVRVVAQTPGGGAADSTTATFVPFPSQLLIIAGGGQTGPAGQPLPTQLEVEVRALDNLPVPGVDVRFRSLSGGTPLDTVVTSDVQGRARVTGVLGSTPGPQTFQAGLPGFPSVAVAAFNATATGIVISPATSIVTVASGSVVSGNTVQLRLQAKDGAGNDITTGGANVAFTRSGGTSSGSIGATADGGNGVYTAVFTGVLAGTATTIGATINGSPVTSALPTITVSPGAISTSGSVVSVSTGTVASGAAVTLRLQGKDAAGNSVTTGGASVLFSASGGTSTGNIGATADSGNGVYVASFTGVLAGTGTSIGATIDGNPVTTGQPALVVIPGPPAQLAFIGAPSVASTGVVIAPAVQVAARDLAGNATPAYASDVTIAIGTNPGGGALAGTLVRTASGGVATFNDLAIDLPGIGYTLSATASGMASDTTASFDVLPPAGTIFWANPAGGNWSNPANWSGGVVPSSIETAAITIPGTYTVTLDVSDTVGGLQLGGSSGTQTLMAASKTLHVSGTAQINANGVLDWRASLLEGGTVSNAGILHSTGSSTVNTALVTAPSSLIRVQGNGVYGASFLTVTSGFTNTGTILLTDSTSSYGATLNVTAGTLTNGPSGTIDAAVGTAGLRTLGVQLDNQGTMIASGDLTLSRASAAHANSGAINLTGGNFAISQLGTLPSFTNTGAMTLGAGDSVKISFGSFVYNGGSISGGTLSLSSVAVTASQSFSTATAGLSIASSTWGGSGTLTIAPSTAVVWKASTMTAPLVNQGTFVVNGSSAFNGPVSNAAGATLQVEGNGIYGLATLAVASNFTNNGAIVLTDVTSSYGATLAMPSATLTNAASATIESAVGTLGARTLAVALNNQGTVTLNRALTLGRTDAAHTNSGTIDVASGNLTITQPGTSSSFTNTGTITIAAGDSVEVSSGALNLAGGSISGGTLSLTSTTVTSNVAFNTATAALSLASSTWGGSGTLTIAPSTSVFWRASTITAPLVNQATIVVNGSSAFNGAVTNAAGATLRIEGNGVYGLATLAVANSFTNNGAIILTDITSSYGATLSMPSARLTNAPGATIESAVGTLGNRTLAVELDNQGTVTLNRGLTLGRASAAHLNSGTIDVSGGDFMLNQTGTTPSFATSGSVAISAGRTFGVTGGSFDYTAGSISGAGTFSLTSTAVTASQSFSTATTALSLSSSTWGGSGTLTVATGTSLLARASTINAPLVNQGLLVASGTSALNGPLANPVGATLRVQGNGVYGQGLLTIATGFTNEGATELTDTTSSYGATLTVSSGTLVNAPGGTIAALTGTLGPRTLNAQLDNQGTVTVATGANQALTINRPSATHQNSGNISITGGDLVISGAGQSFTNTGAISIDAGDTLRVLTGSFTHSGGTLGGVGTLSLSNVNAAFNAAQTIADMFVGSSTVSFATPQSTGATGFEFLGSTINGPGTFTNEAGKTLILRSTVVNTPLANQGTILTTGGTTINDTLTTGASSLFRLQGNGTHGSAQATVLKGFENAGIVELTDSSGAFGSTLVVTNGKLLNLPGAVVNAVAGANGARTLTAALDNQGTVAVTLAPSRDLVINHSGAVHVNSGTIDISGGGIAINAGTSFQNIGAINLGAGDTLSITNGAFSYDAGTLGTGTLVLTGVNPANFSKPHTLGSIVLNSTTANFAPAQTTASTEFTLTTSVFGGTGTFTNAAGKTVQIRSSGISAPFINQGTLIAHGSSSLDAPATVAGSTIHIEGDGTSGIATLTVNGGLVNNGAIELTDVGSAFGATLVVKTLPLVNAGTIDIQSGADGPRTIDATIDNQGTFTANHGVTISPPAGVAHTNRGTYKVKAGAITFSQPGGNPSFTNQAGGIIDIDAGTVFRVTNGPVTNALGGKIVGFGALDVRPPATFTNDGELIPGASPGTLTIAGNALISASGIITIELGGPTAGTEYDQLVITGAANFAEGTLNVSLLPTLPDPKGLSFDVMTFGPGSTTGPIRIANLPPQCVGGQVVNTGTSLRVVCP